MTKEATLVSFKDLMQAKMEREQREAEESSLPLSHEQSLILSPESARHMISELTQKKDLSSPVANIDLPAHSPTYQPAENGLQPIAPEKDYSKLPNSIKRAVEQGKFPGSSLAIYLYLYSLTRGSIKPKRSVRVSKPNLKVGSNLRADKTLLRYIDHLERIGFIRKTIFNGDHEGNQYEVFLPEEIKSNLPTYLPTKQPTYLLKEIPRVPMVQKEVGRYVETQENKDIYGDAKTSFKDNTDDDDNARVSDTFSLLAKRLDQAAKKITGKGVSKSEAEKWGTLAELLILELEVAASRTEEVSSVPAFLTEVLRRQFFASRQPLSATARVSKVKADTVGKSESGSYEIKSLDAKGRTEALAQLREFIGDDFLDDFKKWYTPDDWAWLMRELEEK